MAGGLAPLSIGDVVALILLIGGVVLLVVLWAAPKGERPHDAAWKDGAFYSNSRDRALLVPKRFGVGYTLNFGNPWAWVLLALILVVAAAPLFLTMAYMRHLLSQMHR